MGEWEAIFLIVAGNNHGIPVAGGGGFQGRHVDVYDREKLIRGRWYQPEIY
ncbi:hypothetical protein GCM10027578_25190 [Spirosoma luteolum]